MEDAKVFFFIIIPISIFFIFIMTRKPSHPPAEPDQTSSEQEE